jgi:hypothetical protein
LFSGGLDSLTGAVDRLSNGTARLLLVSHQSSTKVANRQKGLARDLADRFPSRVLHVPVRISMRGTEGSERTQRTRSFLFGAAELFRVHPNAVRRWVKGGLRTIDSHRPQLIHGTDLIEYLDRRQRGRKRRCAPDQMFCFTCREPRRPAGGCVALVQLSPRWMVQGPCQICGTQMNRASSARRFAELERTFTVTIASPRLSGLADPVVMCDLEKDDDDA